MKKFRFTTIIAILAVFLFGGMLNVKADTVLPSTFVTDSQDRVKLSYITYKTTGGGTDDYSLIAKKATDGTFVYCIDLHKKYDGKMTYTKTKAMDIGINYILKNKPNTGDANKDYYITQMAIYYFQDYILGKDTNLPNDFKKIIVIGATVPDSTLDAQTKAVSKEIYKLYLGAYNYRKSYVEKNGYINITTNTVTFTEKDGYYTSSKIYVKSGDLDGDIKKTLVNATPNTKVYKDSADGGYIIKVPVTDVPEGKKVTFSLKFQGTYTNEKAYYYYTNDSHQRLLYDKLEVITKPVEASITLTVKNFIEKKEINISKTDVTQSKEIPGATLVLKDAKGKEIDKWVSTNETHKITLEEGEYSLTETIAPEGYKLSTTTIYFKIDANLKLYAKVNGKYVAVDKINMINELKDVTSIVKKDSKTDKYVPGAKMVIKDANGKVVKEFISTDSVYKLTLNAGTYTLEEIAAPEGYQLSGEKLTFKVLDNGSLQVKNSNGVFEDSVMVVFYNTPNEDVPVPSTGKTTIFVTIAGITLLITGVAYAIKTTKEC